MRKRRKFLTLVFGNWQAKLICLLIAFLIWVAVKSYLHPPEKTLPSVEGINSAALWTGRPGAS